MYKNIIIFLSIFFLFPFKGTAQDCPVLECFSQNGAMLNSCEEFRTYTRITNIGPLTYSMVTATWDFGDGSAPTTINYPNFSPGTEYPETSHSYSSPGTYVATLTVTGGNSSMNFCTSRSTVTVEVTGVCEYCTTYTVLSTGYDPGTSLPIPVASLTSGGPDPNWEVLRRFDLVAPSYTPDINSIFNFSSQAANVIYPANGYCPSPPFGQSRFISVNTLHNSSYGAPNIHTYRRTFHLPGTFPTNTMYSLVMSVQALDYVFDIQLNGVSIMSNALVSNSNGEVQVNVTSCSGIFKTGSNLLDITVADMGTSTQLDAEVILYECPVMKPCSPGTGWSTSWSWNTNWGYGWFYHWGYWYCQTYGWSGPCPPSGGVSGPGGTPGGWGWGLGWEWGWRWVYISGWGWMWVEGGSSGSGSLSCPDCISSFAPIPGNRYLISAWVKEKNAPQSKTSYTDPEIHISFPSISASVGPFRPSGNIIDGWQQIEGDFIIPPLASNMSIELKCVSNDCYYDDIRLFPFDGSMKSYVYDPVNLRLVAELDERNFATFYEYDEEGKLIRVKKETEKGKMTIKEHRSNTKK
jgi:YD repeat-containing protein